MLCIVSGIWDVAGETADDAEDCNADGGDCDSVRIPVGGVCDGEKKYGVDDARCGTPGHPSESPL